MQSFRRSAAVLAAVLFTTTSLLTMTPDRARAETPLERGTYLARSIVACGNCHTPKNEKGQELPEMELAGGFVIKDPGFEAVTSNITPDRETGIGSWTDAQIIDSIRNGKRPDGSTIGPPMPFHFYRMISDGDVRAIVAYLRSVPAVKNRVGKSAYKFPLPPAYGPAVTTVPEVSRDDPVRYGEYLAGPLGHCLECHTPMEKGKFKFETHLGAGGFELYLPFGVVQSANITPDPATGLGGWSDDGIKRAITTAVGRGGEKLFPPMAFPYYAKISAPDLDAIIAYLRSMTPLPSARAERFKPIK